MSCNNVSFPFQVAVAVKTLKTGSTVDEKLDFLSEADMMKRFDHKNVVKLLGVCTRNEPVYTVMEFMLYGDLKTYLLARRHLVNERNREDLVSSICLRLAEMCFPFPELDQKTAKIIRFKEIEGPPLHYYSNLLGKSYAHFALRFFSYKRPLFSSGRGFQPPPDLDGPGRGPRPRLPGQPQVRSQGRRLQELPGKLLQGGQTGRLWHDKVRFPLKTIFLIKK